MTEKRLSVYDVFKTQGQPTVTYVKRDHGAYEIKLSQILDSKGSLCLLTGPSKTGKTTLYTQVARDKGLEILKVSCHSGLQAIELWRKALEALNFERVSERQKENTKGRSAEGKIGGTFGWAWLAGLLGEISVGISSDKSEGEIREKILSDPSPEHLIPVLKNLPVILVVEDFHYLKPEVKAHVFQQWKIFVDSEVSVIVVGTTHHAADLAHANRDLVGRTFQIDLNGWNRDDLGKIARQGFDYLSVPAARPVIDEIARESVGLPIVTQSVCLQLMLDKSVMEPASANSVIKFTKKEAYVALHQVATQRYSSFSSSYDRLTRGFRKKARKYDTYELVLSTFTLDPLVFYLNREDIAERLRQLPLGESSIPPPASVSSMLKALGRLQEKLGIELLEWSENHQRLYVIEPTFLFYLRWRKGREKSPSLIELLEDLLKTSGNLTYFVDSDGK